MELLVGLGLVVLISAGVFIPLERRFPHPADGLTALSGWAALACLGLFVVNSLAMRALAGPLASIVGGPPVAATTLRVLAVVVLGDLLGYAMHRLMHAHPLLWRFHRLHHQPTRLTWLVAWRQHPLDFIFHGLAVGLPAAVLGVDLSTVGALVLARKLWTSFLHADVRVRFGWLEGIVATPAFHRVHHSPDPRCRNRNFAGTLPIWDVLFGTRLDDSGPPGAGRGPPAGESRAPCPTPDPCCRRSA